MGRILNTALSAALALAPLTSVAESPTPAFRLGYNAVQATIIDDGTFRSRMYNNGSLEIGDLELRAKLMNEGGPNYFAGWETLHLKKKESPLGLLAVTRIGGSGIDSIDLKSQGFGARLDLDSFLPAGMYGFLDGVVWTHTDEDAAWLGEGEIMLFAGKEYKGWNLEGLGVVRPGGNNYGEIEVFPPGYETSIGTLRPMLRVELPGMRTENASALVGAQLTLK